MERDYKVMKKVKINAKIKLEKHEDDWNDEKENLIWDHDNVDLKFWEQMRLTIKPY